MERATRTGVAAAGVGAALLWAVAFVSFPRVAMELLVLTSPVIVAVWLVTSLTASSRSAQRGPRLSTAAPTPDVYDAVLARDGRACATCGGPGATIVVMRRPARRGEDDPLARFMSLCGACAAATPLARPRHRASRPTPRAG